MTSELNNLISKARRGKLEPLELRSLVESLQSLNKSDKSAINALIRKYQRVYESAFITSKLTSVMDAESAQIVIAPIQERLRATLGDGVKRLGKIIEAGARGGGSTEEIADVLTSFFGSQISRAATNVNTARIAINRANAVNSAEKDGVKFFRYVGASFKVRPFCGNLLGKVFAIEEIKQMSNNQGLPVLHYCGGYNCRHRWEAVADDNRALLDRLEPEKFAWSLPHLSSDKKHLKGLGLNRNNPNDLKKYEEKAVEIAKNKINPYSQKYKGVMQFVFFDKSGQVVCDTDGSIKGYYHSNDIEKTIKVYKEKKQCKKIV